MIGKLYLSTLLVSLLMLGTQGPVAAQDTVSVEAAPQTIPDTLLFRIQRAQSIITEIKAATKKGYGIPRIRTGLATVKSNVSAVAADVQAHRQITDAKSFSNYNLMLDDALEKLNDWRTVLSKSTNDLQSRMDQVLALSTDSLLTVTADEPTGKKFYASQLADIKVQLQQAGNLTSAQLDTVSRALADVSGTALRVNTLQTTINDRLRQSNDRVFRKESPYLWEAPTLLTIDRMENVLKSTYQGQNKILRYFFSSTWDSRLLLLVLAGAFFVWVLTNYRRARNPELSQSMGTIEFRELRPVPVIISLIVLFTILPLFEFESPSLYIEVTQFVLLLLLTVHLWKRFSGPESGLWLGVVGLYILLILTNALVGDSLWLRLVLLALNVGLLYVGLPFSRQLHRKYFDDRVVRLVRNLYVLLQVLAILFNLFGRISLAKTMGITATVGLVQLTGLGVFIDIVLEALELQIKISACSGGIFSRVDVNYVRRMFKKGLAFVAFVLWLLVFFINLGVVDGVLDFFYQLLIKPHSFGSVAFTLQEVLSFSVIIYLSSLLQKNIGLLFGERQLPAAGSQSQVQHLSSVLTLIRLVIVVAGVLLAVAVAGISVDKLTVVLGALSVGIGLGMQNIVSNFVSGIILIFEKPFQLGDYVELADKKGRIREIGIRSSKMTTAQGSQVIIPNGDFLSNRLVNWTADNTYLKTEFTLKVSLETDLAVLREIVKNEGSKLEGVLKNQEPEVLITALSGSSIDVMVRMWVSSVYAEPGIKSQLLQQLLPAFTEAGIKII